MAPKSKNNNHINRLKWACRRGMLELDIVLTGFLTAHYENLTLFQKKSFHELLGCQDPDLMAWILQNYVPHASFQEIVYLIRQSFSHAN